MIKNIAIVFSLGVLLGIIKVHYVFHISHPSLFDYLIGFLVCLFYVLLGLLISLMLKFIININGKNIGENINFLMKLFFALFVFLSFSYYGFMVTYV